VPGKTNCSKRALSSSNSLRRALQRSQPLMCSRALAASPAASEESISRSIVSELRCPRSFMADLLLPRHELAGAGGELSQAVDHRAPRNAERPGDLLLLEAVDVVQHRRRPQLLGRAHQEPHGHVALE